MARRILSLLAAIFLCAASTAQADWQVWTTNHTHRVLRDDPAGAGVAVDLQAARNEWQSFQVLIRSDEAVPQLNVAPADLVGPGGAVLRASDVRLYRQHQSRIEKAAPGNTQFQPGWYPDALIPANHPLTGKPLRGARLAAVPFDLPPGQTHGFLVDIHVPAAAKPGRYHGTYRLTAGGGKAVEVPVSLLVWDFELPATPTMKTSFGSPASGLRQYYRDGEGKDGSANGTPAVDWTTVDAQIAQMLGELGFNATPPADLLTPVAQPDGSFRIPEEKVDALREFVDRYHVNAVRVPHARSAVEDPERQRARLDAWLAAFDRAAQELDRPDVLFYMYLKDEPNDLEAYQYVRKWGRVIRQADSAVKVLVVEQPQPDGVENEKWGDLYGAVDIWCPLFPLFEVETATQRQALGETIWTYTALCQRKPMTPWWQIDFPLLHYRVPTWIMWRYRIRGLLYWGGMTVWRNEDPWTELEMFRGRYNGEGMLVYPARAVGYDGIAPSLRLLALRDAIQDYEYMAILERLGLSAEAEKIVVPLASSWFEWNPDPAAYETARARLAEMIVEASRRPQ